MSRRNRTSRRRTYGKRQHEIRDRRPTEAPDTDSATRDDGWIAPELMDDMVRRNAAFDAYDGEGWAR